MSGINHPLVSKAEEVADEVSSVQYFISYTCLVSTGGVLYRILSEMFFLNVFSHGFSHITKHDFFMSRF